MRVVLEDEDEDEGTTWAGYITVRVEDDDGVVLEAHMAPEEGRPLLEEAAKGALERILGNLEGYP